MEVLIKILILGTGGFIGSNLRYWISLFSSRLFGSSYPYGTLFVNAIGSFLLAFLFILGTESSLLSPRARLLLGTGLLGALTTFSTFSVETMNFIRVGSYSLALLNIFLNVILALSMAWLGFMLASRFYA